MKKKITKSLVIGLMTGSLFLPLEAFAQSKVIAKVGEYQITERDLDLAEQDMKQQFSQMPEEKRKGAILSALIDIKSLANAATQNGYEDDEAYKSRMAFIKARTLHNVYFQKEVADKITAEEIKARFDKEILGVKPETEVKARHILLKTEDEAIAVIADLDAGKDFAKLAKEKSTGPSGPNGGDLGYFSKGQMVPEFDKVVFEMKDGDFTKTPVKTQFGWHVILREEERQKPLPEFKDAEAQIKQVILKEKYFALVQSAKEDASLEILDEDLKKEMDAANQQ